MVPLGSLKAVPTPPPAPEASSPSRRRLRAAHGPGTATTSTYFLPATTTISSKPARPLARTCSRNTSTEAGRVPGRLGWDTLTSALARIDPTLLAKTDLSNVNYSCRQK